MDNASNLDTFRGDDLTINLQFQDIDGPINITGWTIYMTIKDETTAEDDHALFRKDITVHDNPTLGQTHIDLLHTETLHMLGVLQYDVQVKTNTNVVKTIMRGTIEFIDDVTLRY